MQPDNDEDEESYTAKADLQLSKAYEILVKELGRLDNESVDRKAPSIVAIEMFAKVSLPCLSISIKIAIMCMLNSCSTSSFSGCYICW